MIERRKKIRTKSTLTKILDITFKQIRKTEAECQKQKQSTKR